MASPRFASPPPAVPLRTERPRRARALLAACAGLALAGCVSVAVPPLPQTLPEAWSQAVPGAVPGPQLQAWWKVFGDPTLDTLIDEALASNLDLAQARSRVRQARLLGESESARWLPAISFNVSPVQDVSAIDNYLHASVDAAWEFGFFGEREGNDRVAQARLATAGAALQGARVTLVAEVVRRYLELRAAQGQLDVQTRLAALDLRGVDLAGVRLRTRLGSAQDEAVARARLEQTRSQLAPLRESGRRAQLALAVLLGRAQPDPAWSAASGSLRIPESAVAPNEVPADLLRTRPDLRLAEASVLKAAGEAGIAQSALYPHVSLGLSYLYSYNVTQNRRASTVTSALPRIGPSIDIPLFDWGRRRAQSDASQEALNESLLAYRQTVLQAVSEVETALTAIDAQHERATHLAAAEALLTRHESTQSAFAGAGLASDFDVLALRRNRLQASVELSDARLQQGLALVALYKALGGAPLPAETPEPAAPDAAVGLLGSTR